MRRKVLSIFLLVCCTALPIHAFTGGMITRMNDGHNVSLSQMTADMEMSDVILIGEVHDNIKHHEMQLDVLRSLLSKKRPLAIGLEMFQADSQRQLDDWTEGRMSEQNFKVAYARNWSEPWPLYRDIFIFARNNRIPLIALNIPKEIVTKVARQGFASLTPDERKNLPTGVTCELNTTHTDFLKKAFKEVFRHDTNEKIFTYFCEAQAVRNNGMALAIANYRKSHPGNRVVALTGIWHAVKNGIPEQLERINKLSYRVILPEIPELGTRNATSDITDYLIGWSESSLLK
jgi:uncharacterized iron-regulated protein